MSQFLGQGHSTVLICSYETIRTKEGNIVSHLNNKCGCTKFCNEKTYWNTIVCHCAMSRTGRTEWFGKIPNTVAPQVSSGWCFAVADNLSSSRIQPLKLFLLSFSTKGRGVMPWRVASPHTLSGDLSKQQKHVYVKFTFLQSSDGLLVSLHLTSSPAVLQDMHLRVIQNAHLQNMECIGAFSCYIWDFFPMWNYHVSIRRGFVIAILDSILLKVDGNAVMVSGWTIPEALVWRGEDATWLFRFRANCAFKY